MNRGNMGKQIATAPASRLPVVTQLDKTRAMATPMKKGGSVNAVRPEGKAAGMPGNRGVRFVENELKTTTDLSYDNYQKLQKFLKAAQKGKFMADEPAKGMKKGGMVKGYAKGGKIDGCCMKGKTKGMMR